MFWRFVIASGILLGMLAYGCGSTVPRKVNGVSFVASRDSVMQGQVAVLNELGANYAAVMPFAFLRSPESPELHFDTDRQWFGETVAGARQYMRMLKSQGIRIMVKPQIWIWRGTFTGSLTMNSEEDWEEFEAGYKDFILRYAQLAEEEEAEILCIGTELERFVMQRPQFWNDLIKEVRSVFRGKLTYAANWDEYSRVPFWESLDYIGVDAYFPLSDAQTPEVEGLQTAWQPWKEKLKDLSNTTGKKILFTEYGYRSKDYNTIRPWEADRDSVRVNLQAQANAQEAILREFWPEEWFAGGFVWKWFIHYDEAGGAGDNRFTPQNKPAQEILRKYYKAY